MTKKEDFVVTTMGIAQPSSCIARTNRRRQAFTLVEILIVVIILGILAAIVIPQFSNATQQTRENTLKDELRYLRTQITVFKAQHQDVAPGYPGGSPSATPTTDALTIQMTQYSNLNCATSSTASPLYPFGQYLTEIPPNPVNGMSTVIMMGNNQTMPQADGTTGWIYQPQTQQIIANVLGNDSAGVPYASY